MRKKVARWRKSYVSSVSRSVIATNDRNSIDVCGWEVRPVQTHARQTKQSENKQIKNGKSSSNDEKLVKTEKIMTKMNFDYYLAFPLAIAILSWTAIPENAIPIISYCVRVCVCVLAFLPFL